MNRRFVAHFALCANVAMMIAALLFPVADVRAESDAGPPPVCPYSAMVTLRIGSPAEVPASIDGFVVRRSGAAALTPEEITVEHVAADGTVAPIPFEIDALAGLDVLVRPTVVLEPGDVLVRVRECEEPDAPYRVRRIELTEARPALTDLGTLTLGEPRIGPGRPFDMEIAYGLTEPATAWGSAYWAAVEVDGVVAAGDMIALGAHEAGSAVLSIRCPGWRSSGLVPDGHHTVRLAAGLWSRPASVWSAPVEVSIECPEPPPGGSPIGPDGCADAGHFVDGGPAPAACPPPDAGRLCWPASDSGDPPRLCSELDAGRSDAGASHGGTGSCSVGARGAQPWLWLGVVATLWVATRRRRSAP